MKVNPLRLIGSLLFIVFLLSSQAASAISTNQQNVFNSGIYYFNTEDTGVCSDLVSGETGSGPLFGLAFPDVQDPNELVTRIDNFIKNIQPGSPFVGLGNLFVAAGQKYDINPAMVVGIANKEESLGTANQPANLINHNSFGATGISGFPTVDGYASFPSFEASIDPINKYLAETYVHAEPGSAHYATTVLELMKNGYTPGSNYAIAAKQTLDVMHKILDGITETGGSTTGPTTSFTPGETTVSQCSSSGGYQAGANGYNLSGQNSMAHFYQCDPQWGSHPYGTGKTSICEGGCGIASLAMVVATLSDKGGNETPLTLADRYGDTYHTDGTSWALWPVAAQDYNLKYRNIGADFGEAATIIRQGGLIIIPVNSSGGNYFTTDSHLMVIRAVDDQGNFYLADPNAPGNKSNRGHDTENTAYSADFLRTHGFMNNLFAFTR